MPLDLGPPPTMSPSDRMRWVVVMAGARDRLRSDLRPEVVTATARRVAASMVEALPWPDPSSSSRPEVPLSASPTAGSRPGALAARLAAKLSREPDATLVRALNAALVLMADHELATSTMAVRGWPPRPGPTPYDALLAGLATLAGPLARSGPASRPTHCCSRPSTTAQSRRSTTPSASARRAPRLRPLRVQTRRRPLRRADRPVRGAGPGGGRGHGPPHWWHWPPSTASHPPTWTWRWPP